jgi:hypothetical protein
MTAKKRVFFKIFDVTDMVIITALIFPAGGLLSLAHLYPKHSECWYLTENVILAGGFILLFISSVAAGMLFSHFMNYYEFSKTVRMLMKQDELIEDFKYSMDKKIEEISKKISPDQYKQLHDYINAKFHTYEYNTQLKSIKERK